LRGVAQHPDGLHALAGDVNTLAPSETLELQFSNANRGIVAVPTRKSTVSCT
jgi:hypothetical protein